LILGQFKSPSPKLSSNSMGDGQLHVMKPWQTGRWWQEEFRPRRDSQPWRLRTREKPRAVYSGTGLRGQRSGAGHHDARFPAGANMASITGLGFRVQDGTPSAPDVLKTFRGSVDRVRSTARLVAMSGQTHQLSARAWAARTSRPGIMPPVSGELTCVPQRKQN